jgi:hypothetical protein
MIETEVLFMIATTQTEFLEGKRAYKILVKKSEFSNVQFFVAFLKLRKAIITFIYVCPYATTRLPLQRIFMEFDIDGFLENLKGKLKFH